MGIKALAVCLVSLVAVGVLEIAHHDAYVLSSLLCQVSHSLCDAGGVIEKQRLTALYIRSKAYYGHILEGRQEIPEL